ncbi:MAG TPA: protein kinase [Gemmatimonadales bacterium]|nr:protein kinase [Gemmatimonadales bacterium]
MSDLFQALQTALADRYQLERELGRGGMATVYLARELKHARRVAIKVLRPELAGVLTRERFLREIRISSEFSHPHILPLLDSGTVPPSADFPALPFYSMPFVEGESLRDRLVREKQLPVDDAVEIARDVAAALGYAHTHGVIHRDIKPENILLTGGHAVVADFGIARAIQEAVDPDALTSAGLVIGTPAYMSPEQAGGETNLDGRSDIYSLGCVLYECLGGDPPFTGSSPQAVLARHRLDQAPSLRTIRSSVPEPIEQIVMRALQKTPADRFATAKQFEEALHTRHSGESVGVITSARPIRGRQLLVGAVFAIGAAALWFLAKGVMPTSGAGLETPGVDTTRYAILSFGQDTTVPGALHSAMLLQDAMARWEGMSLVDPFQVRDIVSRRDTSGFVEAEWRRLALGLGSGRYVRGSASRVGDSIRVHAVVFDALATGGNPAIREHTVRLPLDLAGADSAFAMLADGLLLRSASAAGPQPVGGTSSLPARRAYDEGSAAINDWDLTRADSSFSAAVRFDPQYAQAHLWLALVRSWSDPETAAAWQSAAERAAAGRPRLSGRDRQISDAVLASTRGDAAGACRIWEKLTGEDPHDFVVWYGLATCLRRDNAVVRDGRSPTRWRFRSSYHQALNAYQRAYVLLPSIHKAFREESFDVVVHQLLASGTDLRGGRALPPDSTTFLAYPSWAGDSLVLFPAPLQGPAGGAPRRTATTADAIHHQRQRVYEIARAWVAAFPASADALQALAVSLELLGDRSALDTLLKARRLVVDPAEVVRVAAGEIWMRVLFGSPADLPSLRVARQLADSLLDRIPDGVPTEPQLLSSLAALTGRAHLAAQLSRQVPMRKGWETPPALVGIASTFLTYAAMGGPADSLQALERRVVRAIDQDVLSSERAEVQRVWLALPTTLAFPEYRLPSIKALVGQGNPLVDADAAFLRGDSTAAWRTLVAVRAAAESSSPADFTIDQLYPETWLMAQLGQPDTAAQWLDPTLNALARTPPQLFNEAFRAGTLVRAMAFRADLAKRAGDRDTARRWAAAVVVLWSDADDFLQPLVRRMKVLAR